MTVPTTIVDALLLAIRTGVADVDTVSSNDFTPAITTASVAALSPAFDLETTFTWESLSSIEITVTHRVPIEFWVKHDGKPAQTMQRARNVGASAVTALVLSDGTGYTLAFEEPVTFTVDPGITTVNSLAWLVATMFVSVRDELSI